MNKIKILKTVKGSPDGINIKIYQKGKEYTVNDSLLKSFIEMGVCEIVQEKKMIKDYENKQLNMKTEKKGRKRNK